MQADQYISALIEYNASDLFLTYGVPPTIRVENDWIRLSDEPLGEADLHHMVDALLTEEQQEEFEDTLELNIVKPWRNQARLRINVFRQMQYTAMAIRRVQTEIPRLEDLGVPDNYEDIILSKRGLVLVVGQTGSGKTTSLAAMIGHRNRHGSGHIVTIEDPIEYVHQHGQCIISQRDVGIDTFSYGIALKNALRQTPDVILIGEIRDRETMEHAVNFAETGHLCVSTLHSNNADQAIERIINFFPQELHQQVLTNLSFNLRAIVSQRLVENVYDGRSLVAEVLLNEGAVRDYLHRGEIHALKELMERNRDRGMQTFDQAILDLYHAGTITRDVALREADNPATLRMHMTSSEAEHKFGASTNRISGLTRAPGNREDDF